MTQTPPTKKIVIIKKRDDTSYYVHTNYPKIFNNTYWGGMDTSKMMKEDEIVDNRNKFISDYQIKDYVRKSTMPKYLSSHIEKSTYSFIDHPEIYIRRDKDYVMISSPYNPSEEDRQRYLDNGWTETYPLYKTTATTFVKHVPRRKTNVVVVSKTN